VGLAVAAAGCTSERIDSELEFQAIGVCATAIEKRLGAELPPGWQFDKEERDGQAFIKAWATGLDTASTPPDYICSVVPDRKVKGVVRVVGVEEGPAR
jgi:hypothetical protein